MSKTTEYRLRPVTRYVLTRFTKNGGTEGASEVLGEFENASIGGQALAAYQTADEHAKVAREFVVVQRTHELDAKVGYAQSAKQAEELAAGLGGEYGGEFTMFSRVSTKEPT